MAKSQQSYNKAQREKNRLKKKEEKQKKKDARKAETKENGKEGIQFAYVDHNGQLTDTPPDPSLRLEVDIESIELGIPKKEDMEEVDPVRKGRVAYFDASKGFGFIVDSENQEKYFTHISGLNDDIAEGDKVSFELIKGLKGLNAVNVTKI